MKKWKFILPSLMVTATMPLISLVGCGKDPNEPGGDIVIIPDFEQDGVGEMTSNTVATILMVWNVPDHIMRFTNLFFRCNNGSITTTKIKCLELTASSCRFQITFNQNIEDNITDGVFNFDYKDETVGTQWSIALENIAINKYTPDLNE